MIRASKAGFDTPPPLKNDSQISSSSLDEIKRERETLFLQGASSKVASPELGKKATQMGTRAREMKKEK